MESKNNFVFPVYIIEKVLKKIIKICKKNASEVFGFLVGQLHIWKGKYYIIIEDLVYIKGAVHSNEISVYEMGNTPYNGEINKYVVEIEKLRKKKPEYLNIGWWHSHPNLGVFLSRTDLDTQQTLYSKTYHVALVIDPIRDKFSFFALDIDSEKGFKELSHAIISSI